MKQISILFFLIVSSIGWCQDIPMQMVPQVIYMGRGTCNIPPINVTLSHASEGHQKRFMKELGKYYHMPFVFYVRSQYGGKIYIQKGSKRLLNNEAIYVGVSKHTAKPLRIDFGFRIVTEGSWCIIIPTMVPVGTEVERTMTERGIRIYTYDVQTNLVE